MRRENEKPSIWPLCNDLGIWSFWEFHVHYHGNCANPMSYHELKKNFSFLAVAVVLLCFVCFIKSRYFCYNYYYFLTAIFTFRIGIHWEKYYNLYMCNDSFHCHLTSNAFLFLCLSSGRKIGRNSGLNIFSLHRVKFWLDFRHSKARTLPDRDTLAIPMVWKMLTVCLGFSLCRFVRCVESFVGSNCYRFHIHMYMYIWRAQFHFDWFYFITIYCVCIEKLSKVLVVLSMKTADWKKAYPVTLE